MKTKRSFLVISVCLLIALLISAQAAYAVTVASANVTLGCNSWSYGAYTYTADRDNTGAGQENILVQITDGAGNVLFQSSFTAPLGPGGGGAGGPIPYDQPPTANPITFTWTSIAGNGLPAFVAYTMTGNCSTIGGEGSYYINAETANVRRCAGTSCRIVARLSRGTAIQIIETVQGAAVRQNTVWYHIQLNGQDGYVHSSLVIDTVPVASSAGDSTAAGGATYYITASARVRSCPNTTCRVVRSLPRGTAIQVIEAVEGASISGSSRWYRITLNGVDAYVHSSLASTTAPAAPGGGSN